MKETFFAAIAVALAGCGLASPPGTVNAKDDVFTDVDATTTTEEPAEGASPYGIAADGAVITPSDGPYGIVADAYAVPDVCAGQCTCAAGSFCFGGGRGAPAFSGNCEQTSGADVGCNPLPAGATDCASLLSLLGKLPCASDPECIPENGFTVFCP